MDIYCKDSDIPEIQKVLAEFCTVSGFKINYDKTTLYRIGQSKEAIVSKYTEKMKVAKDGIDVLGV